MSRAAILAALALSGCATIVNGTHTEVPIRSQPPGANFELRNYEGQVVASGQTPADVRVARARSPWKPARYDLVVTMPGYLTKRTKLNTRLDALGWLDWVLFVPSLIDYSVGSSWKIEDPGVQVLSPDVPFPKL